MTARFIAVPSAIAAGVEVYTSDGERATWIQDYLDFLAAQAVSPRRIRRVARVLVDAATWIVAERPDGPHVLRHTWEGYLLIPCAGQKFLMPGRDFSTGMTRGIGRTMRFRRPRRPAVSGWPN